ncbi:MAG: TonB-dependent receptor plug domain-containing protein [bacterium]
MRKYINISTFLFLVIILNISYSSDSSNEIEYYKGERLYRIQPIVVTATRLPVNISDLPFSVDIISVDKMENKKVYDMLEGMSGIDVISYGSGGGLRTLSIRGSSSTQSLILYNGIPLNSAYDGTMDLGLLPSSSIDRVEVIKGPLSALYGSNGIGGTINIITSPFVLGVDKSSVGGGYSVGSYGFNGLTGNLYYSNNNLGFKVGIDHNEGDGFRKNSDFYSDEVDLNFSMKPSDIIRLDVMGFTKEGELGVIGPLSFEDETAREEDNIKSIVNNVNIEIGDRGFMRGSLSVIKRERHYMSKMWMTDSLHNLTTFSGSLEFNIRTTDVYTLTLGVDLSDDELSSTDIGYRITQNTGIFLQNMVLFGRLTYINGFRVDNQSQWGSVITPRQAVLIKLSDNINLRSSIAMGFRAPTMVELYWPADPYLGGGNPDLLPETSWEGEIGTTIDAAMLNIDADFYYTQVINKIVGWTPYNIGRSSGFGIDFTTRGDIGYGLSIRGDYSYNKTTDEEGVLIDYHPKNRFQIGIDWKRPSGLIRPETEFKIYFTDKRNATYFDGQKNDYITITMPSYKLIDIGFGIEINPFRFNLKVKNLLNRDYQEIYDYPMPGREYRVSISTEFM